MHENPTLIGSSANVLQIHKRQKDTKRPSTRWQNALAERVGPTCTGPLLHQGYYVSFVAERIFQPQKTGDCAALPAFDTPITGIVKSWSNHLTNYLSY